MQIEKHKENQDHQSKNIDKLNQNPNKQNPKNKNITKSNKYKYVKIQTSQLEQVPFGHLVEGVFQNGEPQVPSLQTSSYDVDMVVVLPKVIFTLITSVLTEKSEQPKEEPSLALHFNKKLL